MIFKTYEINKIDESKNFYLFYGKNQGLKDECIKSILLRKKLENKTTYFEKEVLDNPNLFLESIISKSFFENEKIIHVKKVTDKIRLIIDEIIERKITDTIIILDSDELSKKSKLRNFFEKDKNLICIPFYADTGQTLNGLAYNFFKQNKISISNEIINLIVERSNGDRQHLKIELEKIKNYGLKKKKIDYDDILSLTNLGNQYDFSELVDNCLAKNKRKILKIINENNFTNEETISIIRTFLIKTKRLYYIKKEIEKNQDVEKSISSFRPPIFWKDKEFVKLQLNYFSLKNIQDLLIKINETELLIKKNFNTSINILLDFIYTQSKEINNKI